MMVSFPKRGNARVKFILLLTCCAVVFLLLICLEPRDLFEAHFQLTKPPLITSMKQYERILTSRTKQLEQVCQHIHEPGYNDLQSNPMDVIQYHVVGFTSLKWLWCPTFVGLAESNWVHNFMVLMGLSQTDIEDADSIYGIANPVTLVRLWAPELTKKSFALTRQDPEWKSILFVQHPIHRLVAFYQDNLEEYQDDSYYNLGIHIVENYRDQAKLRFDDFVRALDDFSTPIELPHFWEYIQYVLDRGASGPYDLPHQIRPIYRLCDVCAGNYQYIVKTESIAQEDQFLFQKLGFSSDFQGYTTNKAYKYKKLMKDTPKYLEKISVEEKKRLFDLYRLDFELFDYQMRY